MHFYLASYFTKEICLQPSGHLVHLYDRIQHEHLVLTFDFRCYLMQRYVKKHLSCHLMG